VTATLDPTAVLRLLAAVLDGLPRLPAAACRDQHTLFDPRAEHEAPAVAEQRHRQAAALCTRCPALDDCRRWIDSLPPSRRPSGVIAGQLPKRKDKVIA